VSSATIQSTNQPFIQPFVTMQPRNKQTNETNKPTHCVHHHHKATTTTKKTAPSDSLSPGNPQPTDRPTDQLTDKVTDRVTPTNGPGERRKPRICTCVTSFVGSRNEAGKGRARARQKCRTGQRNMAMKPRHGMDECQARRCGISESPCCVFDHTAMNPKRH
jgi:hypothetical protein